MWPRVGAGAVLSSWQTVLLESCGEMLLWRGGCFTHVIHFRSRVKSFDLQVYREKERITVLLCECQLLGYEGHLLLSGTGEAWCACVQIGSRHGCGQVWWFQGCASSKPSWDWHVSVLAGKQRQFHCSFDVRRCLSSHAFSFIFIFWHLETPLGSSPIFSCVLNNFMIRIGKY